MKLKFKTQDYQTAAVQAVVDCFKGQPLLNMDINFVLDQGTQKQINAFEEHGYKNAKLRLTDNQLLQNIQDVQRRQNLPISENIDDFLKLDSKENIKPKKSTSKKSTYNPGSKINLDIEMETGTGKTYCYIKTIFELNKCYGWNKFIIIVPSIAIREGVAKSLEITAAHFYEEYKKNATFFIYHSKQLDHLQSFASAAGINVMIINTQAFNATGKDNRRIYQELDDFQSRRPIDVISATQPILILDEPQKIEGEKTLEALKDFNPLAILRYSATHKTTHHKIHRLDALDAYEQKLVKKIAVRGISIKGLVGSSTSPYLYLQSIEISTKAPVARLEIEVKLKTGEIKRQVMRLEKGKDLFMLSNQLEQYKGFTISQIDYNKDTVEFKNGDILSAGEVTTKANDDTEETTTIRRIQIRETIKAHFEKEQILFSQGIKVLSLFFIDEVAKYRDYKQADEQGEYARIFEEEYEQEYQRLKADFLETPTLDNAPYRKYLDAIDIAKTHDGYFSIDKKTKRLKNPEMGTRAVDSDDVDAYDLILKNKEKLLSFREPVRFIFSHSALREGWDNPNVFVICMLKHSDNTISRRQEVGRGLRLCVNQNGDRMNHPSTVHNINVLTVVASESYKDFVKGLQTEISESLSARPRKADENYFKGKILKTENGNMSLTVTAAMAKQIYKYLLRNDYTDDDDQISETYQKAKADGTLKPLPEELQQYSEQIFTLVDDLSSNISNLSNELPLNIGDDRKPKTNHLNKNFNKKEFQELWKRINKKAIYKVEFKSEDLIKNCIAVLNKDLKVASLQYIVESGIQNDQIKPEDLKEGESFKAQNTSTQVHNYNSSAYSSIKYDLLGKISESVDLTRATVAKILQGINEDVFAKFKQNPEHFISEVSRLINEQKATIIIQHLSYDEIKGKHNPDDTSIFTANQSKKDFAKAAEKLKKHIYDYAITDSQIERDFVEALDISEEVVVYAKLPRGFFIPTPVGDYNPDWAISFKEGSVKHIYFVAETKGGLLSMTLRTSEKIKIECAKKFFDKINEDNSSDKLGDKSSNKVKYDIIRYYSELMDIIR